MMGVRQCSAVFIELKGQRVVVMMTLARLVHQGVFDLQRQAADLSRHEGKRRLQLQHKQNQGKPTTEHVEILAKTHAASDWMGVCDVQVGEPIPLRPEPTLVVRSWQRTKRVLRRGRKTEHRKGVGAKQRPLQRSAAACLDVLCRANRRIQSMHPANRRSQSAWVECRRRQIWSRARPTSQHPPRSTLWQSRRAGYVRRGGFFVSAFRSRVRESPDRACPCRAMSVWS